jgi:methionyl-tRNA formyltransferase
MNLAFFSSSSFTLPILKSIHSSQNITFWQILQQQLKNISPELLPSNFTNIVLKHEQEWNQPVNLKLVISQPDKLNRNKIVASPISTFAKLSSIPLWTPENLNKELESQLDNLDIILTASYGQFIGSKTLSKPKFGSLNWHPSLLPKYRGATPLQSALQNGDNTVGLSWINMTKEMDEGKVYWQTKYQVQGSDTFDTIINHFGDFGGRFWAIALACKLMNTGFEQDKTLATNCNKLQKTDGLIDLQKLTANQVFWHYQAMTAFPKTYIEDSYFKQQICIIEAKKTELDESKIVSKFGDWVVTKNNKQQQVFLRCKNETYFETKKIALSSGKILDLSGYQFKS